MPIRECAVDKIVRVSKKSGPVLSRLWTKVHEILGQCRRPFVLSSALTRLSCHVSFRRYFDMPKSSKSRTNVKVSRPPFFSGETTPTVLQQIVSAICRPPFGKFWMNHISPLQSQDLFSTCASDSCLMLDYVRVINFRIIIIIIIIIMLQILVEQASSHALFVFFVNLLHHHHPAQLFSIVTL